LNREEGRRWAEDSVGESRKNVGDSIRGKESRVLGEGEIGDV
jgi:hypothetical protein